MDYIWGMSTPRHGPTADRKTPEKLSLLVQNYSTSTKQQLSELVGESPRWVKRQLALLKSSGRIAPKRSRPELTYKESDWPVDVRNKAVELREHKKMDLPEISDQLANLYGFKISVSALGFWLRRFGSRAQTTEQWLEKHVSAGDLRSKIKDGVRLVDLAKGIESSHGVHIGEDELLAYMNRSGVDSFKVARSKAIAERTQRLDAAWMSAKVLQKASLDEIASDAGVPVARLRDRMREEGIAPVAKRVEWSKDLECLRQDILSCAPMPQRPSADDLHQMTLGWLAGDGHLGSYGRFTVNHGLAQVSYLYVKFQCLRPYVTTVVTVGEKNAVIKGAVAKSSEQLGISCPGMGRYLGYLKKDGSKNHERIFAELNELGWACYFMDDGSHGPVMTMAKSMIPSFAGRFKFGVSSGSTSLPFSGVDDSYILPVFRYKLKEIGGSFGAYWRALFPELFDVSVKDDLSLSFVNDWTARSSPASLQTAVSYYHRRGFPWPSCSDDYLKATWEGLVRLPTGGMWRDPEIVRYNNYGDAIFKNFMTHLPLASYRQASPMGIFNGEETLRKSLEYCAASSRSILPKHLYDSLYHFNGGVSAFPCPVAKTLADRYCTVGGVVVDPCAGWGGRMLGVASSGRSYVGFEPWDKTCTALEKMASFLGIKGCSIIGQDFHPEEAPGTCDLVLTSPPYADLEEYGRVVSKGAWRILMEGIFAYAAASLNSGGYLVLSIPGHLLHGLDIPAALSAEPAVSWMSGPRRLGRRSPILVWRKN